MSKGKLYEYRNNDFVVEVNYHLQNDSSTGWWGELTFTEYRRISDGDGYMLELDDGRKGKCSLKKMVNKAVSGVPPLYYYRFRGNSPLK